MRRRGAARRAPIFTTDGIMLFTDERMARLGGTLGGSTLAGYLTAHLNRLGPGDYFALWPTSR
jgi:transaldolase/glucose-6-phosphate isomerase